MNLFTRIATLTGLLLALALAAYGQEATLTDVLTGKAAPLSIKLKELDGTWRSFRLTAQADSSSTLMMMMAMGGGRGGQTLGASAYYTKGQLVTLGGESFVVAYSRPAPSPLQLLAGMHGNDGDAAKPVQVTPDTELTLSLLNVRSMGDILNIRPFNMQEELGAKTGTEKADVKAGQDKSLNNLRQLAVAVAMYTQDNDEQLPENLPKVRKAVANLSDDIFIQPITGQPYLFNAKLSGMALGEVKDPTSTILAYETAPWPDGQRAVAYLDGHVSMVNAETWARQEAKMKK